MKDFINKIKNNKKIIYVAIPMLLVIVVVSIFIIVKPSTNKKSSPDSGQTNPIISKATAKATADAQVTDSLKIFKTEPTKAKSILQQARQKYVDIKDTNGVSNVDSLLCIFDNSCSKK